MKKINPIIILLSSALILAIGYIIFSNIGAKTGVDLLDKKLFNDVSVDCSDIEEGLLQSKLVVRVKNMTNQTLQGVSIKVVAYDKNGKEIKTKNRSLDEVLSPKSTVVRYVNVPKRTKECRCTILSTTTNY